MKPHRHQYTITQPHEESVGCLDVSTSMHEVKVLCASCGRVYTFAALGHETLVELDTHIARHECVCGS